MSKVTNVNSSKCQNRKTLKGTEDIKCYRSQKLQMTKVINRKSDKCLN